MNHPPPSWQFEWRHFEKGRVYRNPFFFHLFITRSNGDVINFQSIKVVIVILSSCQHDFGNRSFHRSATAISTWFCCCFFLLSAWSSPTPPPSSRLSIFRVRSSWCRAALAVWLAGCVEFEKVHNHYLHWQRNMAKFWFHCNSSIKTLRTVSKWRGSLSSIDRAKHLTWALGGGWFDICSN